MNTPESASRRTFLKSTGVGLTATAAPGTLSQMTIPAVHAAEDSTMQIALVGCGGRGTGAAQNALSVQNGPIKLVAMADVFENRLKTSYKRLEEQVRRARSTCPTDRKFIGFDGYKKAMDCLQAGRRRHPRHAAGVPLGPFQVRHREGPQRLHGEAGHGRWPQHAARCSSSARRRRRRTSRSASA